MKWLVNEENVHGCRKNNVYDGTFWTLQKTHENPRRCDCVAIQTNGQIFLSLFSLALFIIIITLSCGTGRINWIAVHTSLSLLLCASTTTTTSSSDNCRKRGETSMPPPFDIIFQLSKIIILKILITHTHTIQILYLLLK